MKFIVDKLTFLVEIRLSTSACNSTNSMKLILIIELSNESSLNGTFCFIFCSNIHCNKFPWGISLELNQAVLIAEAVVELTIGILKSFTSLDMVIEFLNQLSFLHQLFFSFRIWWCNDVVWNIYFSCDWKVIAGTFNNTKVTWVDVWVIPEKVCFMNNTILHDMFTPTLLVAFTPKSCVMWCVTIIEKFDRSTIAVKFIILELTFLNLNIVFCCNSLSSNSMQHVGVFINLSKWVRHGHCLKVFIFESIKLNWYSIFCFMNI